MDFIFRAEHVSINKEYNAGLYKDYEVMEVEGRASGNFFAEINFYEDMPYIDKINFNITKHTDFTDEKFITFVV